MKIAICALIGFVVLLHPPSALTQSQGALNSSPNQKLAPELGRSRAVPFELRDGFLIVVEGRIGERDHLKFILDTGVTKTVVDRKLAKSLDLPLHPYAYQVSNFDKIADLQWALFPAIEFGTVEARNAALLVGDLSRYSEFTQGIDALIGVDLLASSSFTIDYETMTVVFASASRVIASSLVTVSPCLIATLHVQNQEVHLIVDSGLSEVLLFEDKLRRRKTPLALKDQARPIRMGQQLRGRRATLSGVLFGTREIDMPVVVVDGPSARALPGVDGYLGVAMLKAHRISFNFTIPAMAWQ